MERINYNIKNTTKPMDYFNSEKLCFLDIETLGLSRKFHKIYLVGLMYFDNNENSWVLAQFFGTDEREILVEVAKILEDFDVIITYNGESFDLPFLNERFKLQKIDYEIPVSKSFDLFRFIKKNNSLLNLKNHKLKTVEEYLGIFREDIYSGYDCIQFFKDYEKSLDVNLKDRILKHNYDDLVSFLDTIDIISIIDSKKTIILDLFGLKTTLYMEELSIEKDFLKISGSINPSPSMDIKSFSEDFQFTSNGDVFEARIEIKKAYIEEDLLCYFIENNGEFINHFSDYTIPDRFFMLGIGKIFIVENIKEIIKSIK